MQEKTEKRIREILGTLQRASAEQVLLIWELVRNIIDAGGS